MFLRSIVLWMNRYRLPCVHPSKKLHRHLSFFLSLQNSIRNDMHTIELDTSADEQDDLDHCAMTIDPTKSIGHSTEGAPLQTSTYVVYPLTKSPSVPPPSRKLTRYTEQARRNTYTLDESSSDDDPPLINTKPDYVRLDSQGFDPEQEDNVFHDVKDARSTFSIPTRRPTLTRQVSEPQAMVSKTRTECTSSLGCTSHSSSETSCLDQRSPDPSVISYRTRERISPNTTRRDALEGRM